MYKSEEHEKQVNTLVERDVLCNQTYLVDELLKRGYNDNTPIINYYGDIINITINSEEEAKDMGYDSLEALQESGEDQKEVFEWWLLSDWLAEKLEALGCVVIKSDYGTWWGRTETGQALTMDSDIKAVAANLIKE